MALCYAWSFVTGLLYGVCQRKHRYGDAGCDNSNVQKMGDGHFAAVLSW